MPAKTKLYGALLAATISLVAGEEGLRTAAYRDPVGIPTICFGETRNVKMGDTETAAQCKQLLGDRLVEYANGVDNCLYVPVPDKTYEAFVSFAYNVGVPAFCHSTLVKKVNNEDLLGACDELLQWNKARKLGVMIALPGLTARRKLERDLCVQGVTGA